MAMVSEDRNNQRRPYIHQEYPKHVHHEDGVTTKVVNNVEEFTEHLSAGWLISPVAPPADAPEVELPVAAWAGCPGPIVSVDGGRTWKCESCGSPLYSACPDDVKRMHLQTRTVDRTPVTEVDDFEKEDDPEPLAESGGQLPQVDTSKFPCAKCGAQGHINQEICKDCNGLGHTDTPPVVDAKPASTTAATPSVMEMSAERREEFEQAKATSEIPEEDATPKVEEAAADQTETTEETVTEAKTDKPARAPRGGKGK